MLVGIFTARILGPAGRGYYSLFFTSVGLLSTIFGLGISQANLYFTGQDRSLFSKLLGNTILVTLLISFCICGLLLLGLIFPAVISASGIGEMPILLTSFASFVYLLQVNLGGIGYGLHLYSLQAKSLRIQSLFLCISVLLILPFGADPSIAVNLRVLCSSIFLAWYVIYLFKHLPSRKFKLSLKVLQKQIKFGTKNWLQNLIGLLNSKGNIFVLAAISGNEALGFYSVAMLFAECVRVLPDSAGTLLLPKLVANDSSDSRVLTTVKLIRMIFITIAVFSLFMMIMVKPLIFILFGSRYQESILCALLIIPGAAVGCLYQLLTRYFTSQYEQVYSIRSACIGLLISILATSLLAPRYGSYGAAAAYTLAAFLHL